MGQREESPKEQLYELLASQKFAVLCTQKKERPYCSLVAFAFSEDLFEIFFATGKNTRKFGNLVKNHQVSMLFDNRSNQAEDISYAMAATAVGRAVELKGEERLKGLRTYLDKHPFMDKFVSAPSCALIKVQVERYIVVNHFQKVTEWYPRPQN